MKKLSTLMMTIFATFASASAFAQDAGDAAPGRDGGGYQMFVVLALGLVFFYFILWRPEQKRRKQMEEQRSSLKKGDRITAMGIIGTISRVNEHSVIVRMVDGAKIEFLKAAITDVRPATEEEQKKAEKEDAS